MHWTAQFKPNTGRIWQRPRFLSQHAHQENIGWIFRHFRAVATGTVTGLAVGIGIWYAGTHSFQHRQDTDTVSSVSDHANDRDSHESSESTHENSAGAAQRQEAMSLFVVVTKAVASVLFVARSFIRTLILAAIFGPLAIGLPIWLLMERPSLDCESDAPPPRLWWVHWLVWSLEAAGPTFIKLGQWASSRADLFPPYICSALSRLQSNVLPHSYAYTQRTIQAAFGKSIDELFVRFDKDPIGVGAIAQVHYAVLRPDSQDNQTNDKSDSAKGVPCAVKVLHPGVRDLIMFDIAILAFGAAVVDAVVPGAKWLSFPEEVAVFGSMMRAQLDLTKEADHLMNFHDNFNAWSSVGFPLPVHNLVTRDVLVENYIEAVPMTKFLRFGAGKAFDKELAKIGLTTFLKMLILDNMVHADLHPGNILVTFHRRLASHASESEIEFVDPQVLAKMRETNDPREWMSLVQVLEENDFVPYMYIVDTGLVSSLSPTDLRNFLDLFQAITEFNGRLISQLMIERSRSPWTVVDPEGFSRAMTTFIHKIQTQTFMLKNIRVADILGFVLSQVRQHHVKIEGDFANVAISIMLLEGMGRRLEPSMDLLRASVPFLREAISRRMEGHVSKSELTLWRMLRTAMWNMLFQHDVDDAVDRERKLQNSTDHLK